MQTMLFGLLSRYRHSVARLLRSAWCDGGDECDGPRSGVRVPLRSGPTGRSSAVALTEPDDARADVNAMGKHHR
jgi:hypothetical protein